MSQKIRNQYDIRFLKSKIESWKTMIKCLWNSEGKWLSAYNPFGVKLSTKCKGTKKTFSHMQIIKKCSSYAPFIRNPLENVLHQNEVINQKTGKHLIQGTEDTAQDNEVKPKTQANGIKS